MRGVRLLLSGVPWVASDLLAAALVLLGTVAVCVLLVRRRRTVPARLLTVLLGGYLYGLVLLTLFPLPTNPHQREKGAGEPPLAFVNLTDLQVSWTPSLGNQWLLNVAMLVPFGVLAGIAAARHLRRAVAACVLLPPGIETAQLLGNLAAGYPWRGVDVNDVTANWLGAAAGLLLAGVPAALAVRAPRGARPHGPVTVPGP